MAKKMSPINPGIKRIARKAPCTSIVLGFSSAAGTGCASGILIVSRCRSTTTVSATEIPSAQSMPSCPMTRPLKIDVIANDTPFAVPAMPLARS